MNKHTTLIRSVSSSGYFLNFPSFLMLSLGLFKEGYTLPNLDPD